MFVLGMVLVAFPLFLHVVGWTKPKNAFSLHEESGKPGFVVFTGLTSCLGTLSTVISPRYSWPELEQGFAVTAGIVLGMTLLGTVLGSVLYYVLHDLVYKAPQHEDARRHQPGHTQN